MNREQWLKDQIAEIWADHERRARILIEPFVEELVKIEARKMPKLVYALPGWSAKQ